jgi:hypothetical protein
LVTEQPLEAVTFQNYNTRGQSLADSETQLPAAHWACFPQHILPNPDKQNPSRGHVMPATQTKYKTNKASSSGMECEKCFMALHVLEASRFITHSQNTTKPFSSFVLQTA